MRGYIRNKMRLWLAGKLLTAANRVYPPLLAEYDKLLIAKHERLRREVFGPSIVEPFEWVD